MPLSTSEQVNETAQKLVDGLHGAFGEFPGYRPAHAKGTLVTGTFTPTAEAAGLSKAQHFTEPSTPVTIRFSNSTGIPVIPDQNENAAPRGMGIRFHLGGRKHTDIVAHSTPFFPVKTGEGFLGLLGALGAGGETLNAFFASNPSALAFVQAPKPTYESFVGHSFFGIHAFRFISAEGKETFARYQVLPTTGTRVLTFEEMDPKSPNFLLEELAERFKSGPAVMKLVVQVAEEGDPTDDATVHWPEERKVVELGTLSLEAVVEEPKNTADMKYIILDPIPRVEGIEPSEDPLLDMRAAIYLLSGRQRRAAPAIE
ncbi:Catalase-3 [Dactylellina cionopaga]|nr:Catalase-3 [Dactylellina cionopaga]